ncbi:hypothetical protein B0H15DRAFT_956467 [Mycena belliarum]|uniref:Uncharacterized protein n=1 Tax=Mycena belliarum TaxID=1033014 RepID=A0AAD6XF93_9AGAR|nr:hypothetical protein B0H15DRAFT_956467 [Mycena belliae]
MSSKSHWDDLRHRWAEVNAGLRLRGDLSPYGEGLEPKGRIFTLVPPKNGPRPAARPKPVTTTNSLAAIRAHDDARLLALLGSRLSSTNIHKYESSLLSVLAMGIPPSLRNLERPPALFVACAILLYMGPNFSDHIAFTKMRKKTYWILFLTGNQGAYSLNTGQLGAGRVRQGPERQESSQSLALSLPLVRDHLVTWSDTPFACASTPDVSEGPVQVVIGWEAATAYAIEKVGIIERAGGKLKAPGMDVEN